MLPAGISRDAKMRPQGQKKRRQNAPVGFDTGCSRLFTFTRTRETVPGGHKNSPIVTNRPHAETVTVKIAFASRMSAIKLSGRNSPWAVVVHGEHLFRHLEVFLLPVVFKLSPHHLQGRKKRSQERRGHTQRSNARTTAAEMTERRTRSKEYIYAGR